MKYMLILLLSAACSSASFLDSLRERRALVNAVANVKEAAKSLVNSIGSKSSIGGSVSREFEDSCLGGGGIKPIGPWISTNPLIKGKRQEKQEKLPNRDIIFVLDTSGSIPDDQFEKAKQAISILIQAFCPATYGNAVTADGNKQVAVVLFGSTVNTEIGFGESSKGLGYLQDKVLGMKHRREGATATGDALKYVRENVLGKGLSRLNDAQVATDVIVITDGQCNRNCRILGTEANSIRKMGHGVNVFAMGVAQARACELEIITGQGNNLAFGLGDFRNFDRFAQAVKEIAEESSKKCA